MKKRILSLVLIVTMFITIVPFIASASSYDVLIYSFDDENMTASVIGNNNLSSNDYGNVDLIVQKVVIPETVSENGKTYTVTAIGDKTFYNCYFSSVEIPDTVVSIGNSAFEKCINLKNVIIGTAVQYIGKSAFSKCESLESIEIPESVTYIGEYGFNECSSLRSVSLPDSITTIKDSVFNCCVALTSIEIPDSVTTIDKKAFYICHSLENVKIPESVTYIDETAFAGCESIVSIDIDTENQHYSSQDGVLFNKDKTTLICYPVGKQSYVIPDSVKVIEKNAFSDAEWLMTIAIPVTVVSIEDYAFERCYSLTTVYYASTKAEKEKIQIGSANSKLLNATWNYGQDIRNGHVYNDKTDQYCNICGQLDEAHVHKYTSDCDTDCNICGFVRTNFEHTYSDYVDTSCDKCGYIREILLSYSFDEKKYTATVTDCDLFAQEIIVPETIVKNGKKYTVTAIGDRAFESCQFLEKISLPETIESIGKSAFRYCKKITNIDLPSAITCIEEYTFYYCYCLENVEIPSMVTTIGKSAFYECTSLTDIEIPDSVKYIGEKAFYNCMSVNNIKIGSSVETIESRAFSRCQGLTGIEIPSSVKLLGESVFLNNSSLVSIDVDEDNQFYSSQDGVLFDKNKTILICYSQGKSGEYTVPDSVTIIAKSAFYECELLTGVKISDSVEYINESAFYGCSNIKNVEIGSSVKIIGESAFYGCPYIKNIEIPNSVTSIEDSAFYNCSHAKTLTLSNSLISIGESAFYSCSDLESVTIPNSVKTIGESAFYNCYSLKTVTIGKLITEIPNSLFKGCSYLNNVIIPNSVKTIGNSAFSDCTRLKNIEIPNSVKSIGASAFYDCGINRITIPNSVTEIGPNAFAESGLVMIILSDSITTIKNGTFGFCSYLKSIVIPDSVTTIENSAFENCSNLKNVFYLGEDKNNISIVSHNNSNFDIKIATWYSGCKVQDGHVYENDQDTECNVCQNVRELHEHTYSNACDYRCNICSHKRTVPGHVYDNSCDNKCNICRAIRTVTHDFVDLFDNENHWKKCEICQKISDVYSHAFDHDYDVDCNECGFVREVEFPEISTVCMTLNSSLAYKVKVSGITDNVDAKVIFSIADKTYTVNKYIIQDGLYVFTLENIAPHLMTEDITAKLIVRDNSETLYTDIYVTSLVEYCISVIQQDSSFENIVNAVLNYGAAAQKYKNYKLDFLANRSLTNEKKSIDKKEYLNSLDKEYMTYGSSVSEWTSAGLYLDSKAKIKFMFETDEDLKDIYILVENQSSGEISTLENCIIKQGNKSIFYFDGFNIDELDTVFLFTICKDGKPISNTLSYSVESYAYKTNDLHDENLEDLMCALMNYGNIAKNY